MAVNHNGRMRKIILGVAVALIPILIIGALHIYGDVRVLASCRDQHEARVGNCEADLRSVKDDIADIKADVREVRVILQRLERRGER